MAQSAGDSVVSNAKSSLNLSLHPLPILNVSEHFTRLKLQTGKPNPFIIGALLGTQNGREVEIVNSFDLMTNADPGHDVGQGEAMGMVVNQEELSNRKEQYKQVFPSLDIIGWYTVAAQPTPAHILLHDQFLNHAPAPLFLILSPQSIVTGGQKLPIMVYEPIQEMKEGSARTVFIEVPEKIETGEAERIAVDWTAKGGEGSSSLASYLQTQRSAIKMLYERIKILVDYVAGVVAGTAQKDHEVLRSLTALVASLPASEHPAFREEYDAEYADVQLTAVLATLTKSAVALNDIVNNHLLLVSSDGRDERGGPGLGGGRMRKMGGGPRGMGMGKYDRGMSMGLGGMMGSMLMGGDAWGGYAGGGRDER
ncbi:hypothetical protein DL93DRAFT_2088011 [Clavulina sp. PMI_390]|nr:hypothetical protein DL93DRAFT_2088011 [Clavulina sp. PMI_390]